MGLFALGRTFILLPFYQVGRFVAVVGQVAVSIASSVVIRPTVQQQQQQFAVNAASTSVPAMFCGPPPPPATFPSIQQALLSAGRAGDQQQPASTASPAAMTASVVPDPTVIKTLLASKLARSLTQQQTEMVSSHCTTASNAGVSAGNVVLSSSSVPSASSSSLASVSVSSSTSCAPSPLSSVAASSATAAGIMAASKENHVSVGVTPPAVKVENSVVNQVTMTEKSDVAGGSNGLAGTVSSTSSVATVSLASSSSNVSTSTVTAPSPCLANGHAKPFLHVDSSVLVNGICSPVPSCSSEDQESVQDVKVPKSSPRYSSCEFDGVIVNGDMLDNEPADDDDDDDVSDLNDCEGDVLVKAMMHADILDCGGRPAITENSCDDDSHASVDLSQFIDSTMQEQAVNSQDLGTGSEHQVSEADPGGFDSETAAAVADLLHETGMMVDNDEAAVASNMIAAADDNPDNCMSFDNGDNSAVVVADDQGLISSEAMASDALPVPATGDEALASAAAGDSSTDMTASVFDEPQPDCQSAATDITQQAALDIKTEHPLIASSSVSMSSTGNGQADPVSTGLAQPSSSSTVIPSVGISSVSAAAAATQLHNGVMVVPPHGISLPSGQFISGGTRLLIRPIASVANGSSASSALAVRGLSQPTLGPAIQSAATVQSAMTGSSTSTVVDGGVTASSASAVRFVSSTTSQGQLVIQRAQMLNSVTSSPMIQRVVVPQAPRPILPAGTAQQASSQQIASRPVLLTQTPYAATGQLHVAGPGGVQLLTTAPQQATPTQIVLQSGHVISVQPQQPSTNATDQSSAGNIPVLLPKPGSNQQHNQLPSSVQSVGTGMQTSSVMPAAGAQFSAGVNPASLRPLISPSQQSRQAVPAGPVQLRPGMVGLPTGAGNAPVILQHGGRPILLQSSNVGNAQHSSSYVVFRPGMIPVPSSSQEHVNNIAVSSAAALASLSSSSLGPDRKRPSTPLSATVTRSMRKKTKKDEDCRFPFMCEWSGCQRCLFFSYCLLFFQGKLLEFG